MPPAKKKAIRKTRKKATRKKAARRRASPLLPPNAAAAQLGQGSASALDFCPACEEYKPVSEWTLLERERRSDRAFVCRACRQTGKKPRREYLPQLSGRSRRILRDLLHGRSMAEVARKNNLSDSQLHHMLRGNGIEGEMFQKAWQELLTSEGLDLITIAKLARLAIFATKPYWNRRTEEWDFFPDHATRIQALRWITRLHKADPSVPGHTPDNARRPGTAVVVLDLGGDQSRDPAPNAFEIDVTPSSSSKPKELEP